MMSKENHEHINSWRTWAIDEDSVVDDGYSWKEMYEKQRRVPGLVLALVLMLYYWTADPVLLIGGIPIVLYSAWPALGAREYMMANNSEENVE